MIVHHHLIFQASVTKERNNKKDLKKFLEETVRKLKMQILIPAQVAFSHQEAWSGIIGIVTSHISFHYWVKEGYVQADIYSCKEFDRKEAIHYFIDF